MTDLTRLPDVALYVGDVRSVLAELPEKFVHCVVTSPPYFGLRDYGIEPTVWDDESDCEHVWDDVVTPAANGLLNGPMSGDTLSASSATRAPRTSATCRRCHAWRGCLGLEPTPQLYIQHLVTVFRAIWRVLRDDGQLWLNLGDSYAGSWGNQGRKSGRGSQRPINGPILQSLVGQYPTGTNTGRVPAGLKPKDLMLMPARIAIALQDDGWYVRSEIIWAKKAPMPESVVDRPTSAHEMIYLLTKKERYFYDSVAVQQPLADSSTGRYKDAFGGAKNTALMADGNVDLRTRMIGEREAPTGANLRNVWILGPQPCKAAHFAVMPSEIPRRAILAGTSAYGVCAMCGAPWKRVTTRGPIDEGRPQTRRALEIAREKGLTDAHLDALRAVGLSEGGKTKLTQSGSGKNTSAIIALADEAKTALNGYAREFVMSHPTTAGWAPPCTHATADVVPAIVLDPFGGSGTVSVVARELGRRSIYVDQSETYATTIAIPRLTGVT